MQVKLMNLLRAAEHVRETYGDAELQRVVRACPPSVGHRLKTGIGVEWHPHAEAMAFYEAAEKIIGCGDGRLARACGSYAAKKDLGGLTRRAAFWLARPDFVWKRVNHFWKRHNDEGGFRVLKLDAEGLLRFEVFGVGDDAVHRYGCESLSGWSLEMAKAVGWKRPSIEHPECRAAQGERCIWLLRFEIDRS